MPNFDIVVIGAGPAGEVLAGRTAAAGLSTAIVEERLVGGECGYYACIPSKALLRPGEALEEVRRVPGAGEPGGHVGVQAVLDNRDALISDLDDSGQLPWLKEHDIALYRGRGRIAGERTVAVGDELLVADIAVVIAVGSEPALPSVEGLADAEPWTNREATTAKEVPKRLLIMGGGVVGCEMAQAYTSLGAEVTLVEHGPHLLAKEEPWAADQVLAGLRDQGAEVILNAQVAAVERPDGGSGPVTMRLEDGRSYTGDQLLVSAGRRIASDDLGLDTIGVEPGPRGYLAVAEDLRVPGQDWLWVVGDANGRALLTHMAKHQARVTADRIAGDADAALWERADGPGAPRVTFTEPQVAAVGLTEAAARETGIAVEVVSVGTSANAGGLFWGRGADGTSQLVIDAERRVVVGATFTGPEVQDLLQAATFAVVGELTLDQLWHGIAPFPTRSEVWLNLLEAAGM